MSEGPSPSQTQHFTTASGFQEELLYADSNRRAAADGADIGSGAPVGHFRAAAQLEK